MITGRLTSRTDSNFPYVPDSGDGTYRNPILYADYSDPDVVVDGDDFYLTASSFNCTPGLPILHSRDLVNWTIVNHALTNLPGSRYSEVQHGAGVWAPAIRRHAGKFWIFFPTPDEGIYVTTAQHPTGEWSEPHLVQAGKGLIDPCPLWDDDGRAYLVHAYAQSRCGIKHKLRVCEMDPAGTCLINEGAIVFDKPAEHPTLEGPKFYKKNGMYYILAPAGGVETGWQLALRSRSIYGPYEAKTVLEQGSQPVNGPHQGALIEIRSGESWFVHFQDAEVYGRIVHLQPVHWLDGWPMIGVDFDHNGVGEPVAEHRLPSTSEQSQIAAPQTSDCFASLVLGRQWQWQANHLESWYSLSANRGKLRLFAQPRRGRSLAAIPSVLAQKVPAPEFRLETELTLYGDRVGDRAGVAILGYRNASLSLEHGYDGHYIVLRENDEQVSRSKFAGSTVYLRVEMLRGGSCIFSFSQAEPEGRHFKTIGQPFQASQGKWIGAKIGLLALTESPIESPNQFADFSYFEFSALTVTE